MYSMTMSGTCATHVLTKANPKAVWSRRLRCMQVSLCWWSVNCCVQACKQTQRETQGTKRAKCAHVGDTNNTRHLAVREHLPHRDRERPNVALLRPAVPLEGFRRHPAERKPVTDGAGRLLRVCTSAGETVIGELHRHPLGILTVEVERQQVAQGEVTVHDVVPDQLQHRIQRLQRSDEQHVHCRPSSLSPPSPSGPVPASPSPRTRSRAACPQNLTSAFPMGFPRFLESCLLNS